MTHLRQQNGFTLVEIIIVLAVSALLLTGLLAGQGGQREAARFSGTIDGVKQILTDQQNQAQRSIEQPVRGGNYGKSSVGVFGKMVEFSTATPTQYKAYTLVINDDFSGGLLQCDTETHALPNGVTYAGGDPSSNGTGGGASTQYIIFTSNPPQVFTSPAAYTMSPIAPPAPTVPASCSPSAYVTPVGTTPPPPTPLGVNNNILNPSNYDQANASTSSFRSDSNGSMLFQLVSGSTLKADVLVRPSTNTIDRKFFQ